MPKGGLKVGGDGDIHNKEYLGLPKGNLRENLELNQEHHEENL